MSKRSDQKKANRNLQKLITGYQWYSDITNDQNWKLELVDAIARHFMHHQELSASDLTKMVTEAFFTGPKRTERSNTIASESESAQKALLETKKASEAGSGTHFSPINIDFGYDFDLGVF